MKGYKILVGTLVILIGMACSANAMGIAASPTLDQIDTAYQYVVFDYTPLLFQCYSSKCWWVE